MNRRAFLSFLTVAPVAMPMAAKAAAVQQTAPAAQVDLLSRLKFNYNNWDEFFKRLGPRAPATKWDRDALAFNSGVSNIKATFSYAERLPSIVSATIEKTADVVVKQLVNLTEQPPKLAAQSEISNQRTKETPAH